VIGGVLNWTKLGRIESSVILVTDERKNFEVQEEDYDDEDLSTLE
jgi:hypothetical protein